MSNYYSNPTANTAMGAVDKEIRAMLKWAGEIRRLHLEGRLGPAELALARKYFRGIHRRFLEEALRD